MCNHRPRGWFVGADRTSPDGLDMAHWGERAAATRRTTGQPSRTGHPHTRRSGRGLGCLSSSTMPGRTSRRVSLGRVKAGRTTNIASIIRLLGAFVGAALVWACSAAGLVMPTVGADGCRSPGPASTCSTRCPSEFTAAPLSQQSRILDANGNVIATPHDENRIIVPLTRSRRSCRRRRSPSRTAGSTSTAASTCGHRSARSSPTLRGGRQHLGGVHADPAVRQDHPAGHRPQGRRHDEAAQAAVTQKDCRRHPQAPGAEVLDPLEKEQTKDQILEGYLNLVYYGDRPTASRPLRSTTSTSRRQGPQPPEAALLAGLAQNPGTTDPVNNPRRRLARRNVVLDRMHELGLITDKECDRRQGGHARAGHAQGDVGPEPPARPPATSTPTSATTSSSGSSRPDRWSRRSARRSTSARRKIFGGGLTIQTTLDPRHRRGTPATEVLKRVPQGNSYTIGAAAVTLDPTTGSGAGHRPEHQVHPQLEELRRDRRQLGRRHQVRRLRRVPVRVDGEGVHPRHGPGVGPPDQHDGQRQAGRPEPGGVLHQRRHAATRAASRSGAPAWNVRNDETAGGQMTITQATARSINTAFIALAAQVGVCKRAGDRDPDGPAPGRRQPDLQGRPVGHHPRDPGGLADDRRERLRRRWPTTASTARRSRSRASPARTARSCRSTSRARRTASRSSTPRSRTASPTS